MHRYFIHMAYDGSRYKGWQVQPGQLTVQGVLEEAFSRVFRFPVEMTGCGRTDSGVHASSFIAHFDLDEEQLSMHEGNVDQLSFKMNRLLPPDILIHSIREVDPDLHARFSALSRSYRYIISKTKPLFNRAYSHYVYGEIDSKSIVKCCRILEKTSDFSSFARLHSNVKTHICKLSSAKWTETAEAYHLDITADRFLRNMVRAIAGTLLDVGQGRVSAAGFQEIIDARDRCRAGQSAPAKGLFLTRICYPGYCF
ncbi:MAG: tRNA pseudouridine(38-40) synthase TruA [Bacteroidetes bacterium]|nr:MAG: tRNA pseudouridine(38-40) synthase TruA [Bacteroidota bacterium]